MTDGNGRDEALFAKLAGAEGPEVAAPSRLKARVYSALMRSATESRQMLPLAASLDSGACLCVFERFVHSLPLPAAMDRLNYCRFCHPRWMAESIEGAPVWWKGCPYADFQRH